MGEGEDTARPREEARQAQDALDAEVPRQRRKRHGAQRPSTIIKKERRRTRNINAAFDELRRHIPNVPPDTKLSKIKTLKLAMSYIHHLEIQLGTCRAEAADQGLPSPDGVGNEASFDQDQVRAVLEGSRSCLARRIWLAVISQAPMHFLGTFATSGFITL